MKTVVQMLEKDKVDYVFEHLVVALGRMRCGTGISFHQLKRHLGYGSILYNGMGVYNLLFATAVDGGRHHNLVPWQHRHLGGLLLLQFLLFLFSLFLRTDNIL